jgi:hypothetical protein
VRDFGLEGKDSAGFANDGVGFEGFVIVSVGVRDGIWR